MSISRRHFFYGSLAASAVNAAPTLKSLGYKSPSEKLNIAAIGSGGKGFTDLNGCAGENIVALCDPDDKRAERAFKQFPNAPKYKDFRVMLDKHKDIDAVLVSCPDHMHATASMWAMARGKHVYCQKPLTRTVWEAQQLTAGAAKYGVATQMGNQGYSNAGARECAEIIWSGEIGNVTEVHAWTDRPGTYWPQGTGVEPKTEAVPAHLDWNAWLGASPDRPYSPAIAPRSWRAFPEYGCGAIGDMACHIMGTPNMAMRLSLTGPTSVECIKKEGVGKHTFPNQTVIRFDFPARGPLPPVKVFWYDSLKNMPKFDGVPAGELIGDKDNNGSLFYGERTRVLPDARMKDYKLPAQLLTRSPGHYRDWLRACKGGDPACSNFSVAGPFVQWMLLGVIAMKVDGKLEWDNAASRFTNNKEANELLKPVFRKGWHFVG
jgi:predicted dehydrogenase